MPSVAIESEFGGAREAIRAGDCGYAKLLRLAILGVIRHRVRSGVIQFNLADVERVIGRESK